MYLVFLFVTVVVCAPVFTQGRVLLGNTDNLYTFYPNLIYGQNLLRSGDLGLWNPLLFAGMDGSASMHLHMLNPINWVLALVPNSLVLQAITIKGLLEVSLIGFFVFLSAESVVRHRMTAIACGLAFELSGFIWYVVGMYYSVNMLLATIIYIYLLLTYPNRAAFWNFAGLSLCFGAIMLGGNPGYAIAFLLPAPLMVLVARNVSSPQRMWMLGIVAAAGITGLSLAGFRIVNVALQAAGTSRAAGFMPKPSLETVPANNAALVLPGIVPGVWGLNYAEGTTILRWLKVEPNLQFSALAYLSVLPLLLIFAGMSGRLGKPAAIASALAAFLVVADLGMVPMAYELAWAVVRPLHPIVFKAFSAFVAGAAVILGCRHLANEPIREDLTRVPLAVSLAIVAACFQMWTKCIYNVPLQFLEADRPILEKLLRFLTLVAIAAVIVVMVRQKRLPLRLLSNVAVCMFGLDAAFVGFIDYRHHLFTGSPLALQSLVYMSAAVLCGGWIIAALRKWTVEGTDRRTWTVLVPVTAAAAIVAVVPIPEHAGTVSESVIFVGAMLSIGRFLALAVLGIELLGFVQTLGWRPVLPFVLVFLFSDAVLLGRAYENFGYKGFDKPSNMYVPLSASPFTVRNAAAGENMLLNPALRLDGHGVNSWTVGGAEGFGIEPDSDEPGAAIIRGSRDTTLFQDVPLPDATQHIVFGAWVKSNDPRVGIVVTAKRASAEPFASPLVHHSGSGLWEWLSVPLDSGTGMLEARPHLFVFGSEGELLGPVLATGSQLLPQARPKSLGAGEGSVVQPEAVDLAQYRVNFPQVRFGYPAELFSNIAMLYGVATYGGTDSTVDPELERMLSAFVADRNLVTSYAVMSAFTEPRILDLLGVRYDFRDQKVRPNALARFSIFSGFEVAQGFDAQLARLKDPRFSYTTTVLIDGAPKELSGAGIASGRFAPAPYTQLSTSHVRLNTHVNQPSILLFNDSYSRYWRAYRNGRQATVLRANAHFMAIALPAGDTEIEFRFEPTRFYRLAAISIATFGLLILAAAYKLVKVRPQ